MSDTTIKERFAFDNWASYVDYAERAAVDNSMTPNVKPRSYRGGLNIRPAFQCVGSYAEAIRLASAGWPEGAAMATKLADKLVSRLTGYIQRDNITYDVSGELLDVARYAAGEPEHWGVWHHEIVEGPGVKFMHIVVNGTASAGILSDILIRRGATLAALINLLELAHYRARVTLVYRAGSPIGTAAIDVHLKDFEETLDLDKLTYALAHPAAFRCLTFCVLDTIKDRKLYGAIPGNQSYGLPGDVTTSEKGDLYLPKMEWGACQWESEDNCTQWLIQELQRQRVLSDMAAV